MGQVRLGSAHGVPCTTQLYGKRIIRFWQTVSHCVLCPVELSWAQKQNEHWKRIKVSYWNTAFLLKRKWKCLSEMILRTKTTRSQRNDWISRIAPIPQYSWLWYTVTTCSYEQVESGVASPWGRLNENRVYNGIMCYEGWIRTNTHLRGYTFALIASFRQSGQLVWPYTNATDLQN